MTRQVAELVDRLHRQGFVGRSEELALLVRMLDEDQPVVTFFHGLAGIGKSALLTVFSSEARDRGAGVVSLDCRDIEPTERGFLHALSTALRTREEGAEGAAHRLAGLASRVVITLDTYEVFRLLDTWLRQVFIPLLPQNVRVVLAGREAPLPGWIRSSAWRQLLRTFSLGPLSNDEARELLGLAGIEREEADRINQLAHGHPLALTVATVPAGRQGADLHAVAEQRIVEELTSLYLSDLDLDTRRAVEAAAVVRRATIPLLDSMLGNGEAQAAFDRLRALPFVELKSDGLALHETVQQAVASHLRAADPATYRRLRRAAWRYLRSDVRVAGTPELWRYTADLLYLIENPVTREAFFPSTALPYSVEPATPEDYPAIQEIIRRHEPDTAAQHVEQWLSNLPRSFRAVRSTEGSVEGFYSVFESRDATNRWLQDDPVTAVAWDHLRRYPVSQHERVLLFRRWLDREQGEKPSPVQAACWLDLKRAYMELRPELRRIYGVATQIEIYGPVSERLGFRLLPEGPVTLGAVDYHVMMLDFGPSSVDGWLSWLAAGELGTDDVDLLDIEQRQLVLGGERVQLTGREFEVISYLHERTGRVATRFDLLRDVWGYQHRIESNVVDVVVRSVRRKLGDHAWMIETVRGSGYRLRMSPPTSP